MGRPENAATANAAADHSRRWRLPAREIERLVGEAVISLFADRAKLARLARQAQIHEARVSELLEGVRRWSGKPLEVVQRVDLGAEEMTVHVDLSRFLGRKDAVVRDVIPPAPEAIEIRPPGMDQLPPVVAQALT